MNDSRDLQVALRALPAVHRLLAHRDVQAIAGQAPAALLTMTARSVLQKARETLLSGARVGFDEDALAGMVTEEALRRTAPCLTSAVNATGIVLHTGLGRARLSRAASEAVREVAENHSLLEIEQETGRRGSRQEHVRGLLCELTGAQDALAVNNCAGAVFLAVTALAAGKEVLLSRGELVEIGGAFRMPDIIRASGAKLVEVGTTNRTRRRDYEEALTPQTGLILRCHPSNFALIGFTEETPTEELVALGRRHQIPVMDDQGSGALFSLAHLGVGGRTAALGESVAFECDVVTASGDKLLGGPQAGLVLGTREAVSRIAGHPLARALRIDKLTLAALEATLRLYRDPERARREIPTLRYLTRTEPELRRMANRLRLLLRRVLPEERFVVELVREQSQVGGGSLPGENLPTVCVALRARVGRPAAEEIATLLRRNGPPIFTRIKSDAVLMDPRTLEPEELGLIAAALNPLRSAPD